MLEIEYFFFHFFVGKEKAYIFAVRLRKEKESIIKIK